jgi:hypothetical protein
MANQPRPIKKSKSPDALTKPTKKQDIELKEDELRTVTGGGSISQKGRE